MTKDLRGGHPTFWTEFGLGPRKALMIHCSLAHSGAWKGVAGLLGERLTMRAFDLPGHGRSDDWPENRDIQDMSVAMAADVIGADGPMDVIGHSFGATVALRLAVERPDLVRSLVLIESVFMAAALADNPDLLTGQAQAMGNMEAAMTRGDRETAAREFLSEWGDGRPWEEMPDEQRAAMTARIHLIGANNPNVMDDARGLLEQKLIETVEVPVLLIRGGASSAMMAPTHAAIARRLQNARSIAIEGAGHMVPITHPGPVAEAIAAFLDTVPVAGAERV